MCCGTVFQCGVAPGRSGLGAANAPTSRLRQKALPVFKYCRPKPGGPSILVADIPTAGLGQPDSRTTSLREVRLRDCRAWDTPTAGPENRKVGQCRSSADRRAGLGMERSPCGSGGYYRQTDQSEKHCASRARVRQGRAPAGQCGWRQAAPRLAPVFHSVAGPVFRAVPAPIPRATFCP